MLSLLLLRTRTTIETSIMMNIIVVIMMMMMMITLIHHNTISNHTTTNAYMIQLPTTSITTFRSNCDNMKHSYYQTQQQSTTIITTRPTTTSLQLSSSSSSSSSTTTTTGATTTKEGVKEEEEEEVYDYTIPEDAIIHIKPMAMRRLRELRDQRRNTNNDNNDNEYLILRMGVRSGGCSGMSYIMDFCTVDSINVDDDQIDIYEEDRIQCVVDSKSVLYLYGLQLNYSTELIGGGFKFYNPNAEESCGCGSSFGV